MRTRTFVFCLLLIAAASFGICSRATAQVKQLPKCHYSREQANIDLRNNTAKILIQGGFAPAVYPSDKEFLGKYKVGYYIFGCVAPEQAECLQEYNKAIFEHLDKAFGHKWQKDVRKDAFGIHLILGRRLHTLS